jgi:hypothetical protein
VVPATASLSAGEIAVNTADGKLFTKATNNTVKTFLNAEQQPYTLDVSLSSSNYQYGSNTVTGLLAGVLGGVNNDVSGAGSTVINGSDNDIEADYALIGNGSNNTILTGGDFGAILGGVNNTLNHSESFILGSNITSHLSGFTYVNNLTAAGKIYGDGSGLTGIIAEGIAGQDTEVRALTSVWQDTYTIVQTNSSNWGSSQQTLKKHDYVEYSSYSVSYCGNAPVGSLENEPAWNISKLTYTDVGTVSSTQTVNNANWTGRLTAIYS